jgi:uncharacterized protein (DUF1778 family)
MSTLSLGLPNSLHESTRRLVQQEGISINQFIASAAAEKTVSLLTESYLKNRATKADYRKFKAVLDKVPDVEPENYDKL